jgi:hypothetical protein
MAEYPVKAAVEISDPLSRVNALCALAETLSWDAGAVGPVVGDAWRFFCYFRP